MPLVDPAFKGRPSDATQTNLPYAFTDLLLISAHWSSQVSVFALACLQASQMPVACLMVNFCELQPLSSACTAMLVQIVGKVSSWIEPDAPELELSSSSQAALKQELEWAVHLSLQACLLQMPPSTSQANFACIINQVCACPAIPDTFQQGKHQWVIVDTGIGFATGPMVHIVLFCIYTGYFRAQHHGNMAAHPPRSRHHM
jgi:hypothetical protein